MSDSNKSDADWKAELSDEQYNVCRCGGTEPPFSGEYWNTKTQGTYVCSCCGVPLFSSDTKYDSGSGWPSFWQGISPDIITEKQDVSHGMIRTEILCSKCNSHLGHVFPDGPEPTGLRYCVNSLSLKLVPDT